MASPLEIWKKKTNNLRLKRILLIVQRWNDVVSTYMKINCQVCGGVAPAKTAIVTDTTLVCERCYTYIFNVYRRYRELLEKREHMLTIIMYTLHTKSGITATPEGRELTLKYLISYYESYLAGLKKLGIEPDILLSEWAGFFIKETGFSWQVERRKYTPFVLATELANKWRSGKDEVLIALLRKEIETLVRRHARKAKKLRASDSDEQEIEFA